MPCSVAASVPVQVSSSFISRRMALRGRDADPAAGMAGVVCCLWFALWESGGVWFLRGEVRAALDAKTLGLVEEEGALVCGARSACYANRLKVS